MPSVYGNLKIFLIGKPDALDRVADVMSSLKTYTGPAERFLNLWHYAYKCPSRATYGREMAVVDEFWEDVTPVMNLLIELGKAMPELEIQSVCRVAGAITDVKCLFTVVKARESDGWACPTWQNIDMAGAVLEVKFPRKAGYEMKNSNLAAAKRAKNDEFYTRREDIENELMHYRNHFVGKTVYCNCDDPSTSEFWKFFQRNFEAWGLKRLIATHYESDAVNFSYMIEMSPGDVWNAEPVKQSIQSNGDFRSVACVELLKEADIVVTNPPFSLFREYMALLIEHEKKFLIIGSMNAITYKEIFPLLKNNQIWLGYTSPKEFVQADGSIKKFGNILWYTNLDNRKRHEPLDLRGVYYDPGKYPRYVNYDAIEVSRIQDIPCDYNGAMGVPITFLNKYCPEQFEIVGISLFEATPIRDIASADDKYEKGGNRLYIRVGPHELKRMYERLLIRRK